MNIEGRPVLEYVVIIHALPTMAQCDITGSYDMMVTSSEMTSKRAVASMEQMKPRIKLSASLSL